MATPTPSRATAVGPNEISITAAYPRRLLNLLAERGHDIGPALLSLGLNTADLDGAEARVSLLQYAAIAQAAMDATGDEGLGCALALNTPPTAHGPLGYAMMTAATLGDALALGLRYMPLLQGKAVLAYQADAQHAILCPLFNPAMTPPLPLKRFFAEAFMVGVARSAAWLAGLERIEEGELWFDFPEPPYHALYATQLPPVRHGMPTTQWRVPLSVLQRRLPLADRASCERALAQCDREMAWLAGGSVNLSARVREHLQTQPGHYPGVDDVAEQLNLSSRTLKRRLAQQGTSFSALLEEARQLDAIALLRKPQLSLERVATELGYADPANFTRAFKRWTGLTPSAFRDKDKSDQAVSKTS